MVLQLACCVFTPFFCRVDQTISPHNQHVTNGPKHYPRQEQGRAGRRAGFVFASSPSAPVLVLLRRLCLWFPVGVFAPGVSLRPFVRVCEVVGSVWRIRLSVSEGAGRTRRSPRSRPRGKGERNKGAKGPNLFSVLALGGTHTRRSCCSAC